MRWILEPRERCNFPPKCDKSRQMEHLQSHQYLEKKNKCQVRGTVVNVAVPEPNPNPTLSMWFELLQKKNNDFIFLNFFCT